jgi:N-acetylneuraminic acid mutarotase
MNVARLGHTATLLANGEVLAAGGMNSTSGFLASSEVYNPATGKWTLAGNLSIARFDHGAVLLNNGKVLVAGGLDPNACCGAPPLSSAELFDPATGQWMLTGSMNDARENFILIALQNGKVLAAGGNSYPGLSSAELYDPGSGTWSLTGSVDATPVGSAAVLLTNGQVFAVGNHEIYNPLSGTWGTTTAPLPSNRGTVNFDTRLLSGQVWVGTNDELFDPSSAEWTAFGAPSCDAGNEHCGGGGALLTNGQVLIAGGTLTVEISGAPDRRIQTHSITAAALWNPTTQEWTITGNLVVSRFDQTMTTLLNGQVLVAGGQTFDKSSQRLVPIADAELYKP